VLKYSIENLYNISASQAILSEIIFAGILKQSDIVLAFAENRQMWKIPQNVLEWCRLNHQCTGKAGESSFYEGKQSS